ncbi:LacI family DNA-binding transcriptional regulator [Caproiciproducens galactitolivorans]|uniref:LacI family DNA-binding transcriptional regulator n=1 Tax=Caproiciproducens galactitolivorans TaxID=642589 RepID=A0ABT4BTZ6_9FIRM|nr:LacI family DNA-binding transcriptional regulator [Caproiciproducens galactitolivorans]MCY1714378.1 LacI family DNA-binding transcriptional regulator [Caproiciproducens galactitolivorans]
MKNRITIKQVAQKAGVSPATVSYVLNNKKTISAETKQRVWDAISALDYVPDLSARSLTAGNSKLIGVLVPQTEEGNRLMFENNFYSEILGSIELSARLRGYHVLISAADSNEKYLTLVKERNLDGIIAIGVYPDSFYQEMKKSQKPIVLVDSYCNDHYYHSIRIDDAYGSYLATKYMIDHGHREIAFFCGEIKDNGVMKQRLQGYREAMEEQGLSFSMKNVFEGKIDYENGIKLANTLCDSKSKATAVVASADILAITAIKAFYERGLRVPEDFSVIGFDDLQISKYLTPGLTTVHQDISRKGERAMELLFQSIEDPNLTKREEIMAVNIVERGSVKSL